MNYVAFMKAINSGKNPNYISDPIAKQVTEVIEDFYCKNHCEILLEELS